MKLANVNTYVNHESPKPSARAAQPTWLTRFANTMPSSSHKAGVDAQNPKGNILVKVRNKRYVMCLFKDHDAANKMG